MKKDALKIIPAIVKDAELIAEVHLSSWRSAYRFIKPG